MSFIENNKDLLLVHSSMDSVNLTKRVDIMLTPQFYTLKREELPVKYAYQAKKIAPSLFDGLLEDDKLYEYVVFKEEDDWVFIAYDIEEIINFLESKNINLDKIGKIYFAQQSLIEFVRPIRINNSYILDVIDNTVVVVPRPITEAEEALPPSTLKVDNTFTPKTGGVTLKGSSSNLISSKQTFTLATIFMLFAGIFLIEGMRYGGDSTKKEELKSLYAEYPTFKSMYTRQGVIEKYRTVDKVERKKRDIIKTLSSMIFKGVNLINLESNQKKVIAVFQCDTAETAKRIKILAKKAHLNTSSNKTTELIVEGSL